MAKMTNEQYEQALKSVPDEVKEKFIIPIADRDPIMHNNIMAFILILQEKGYVITKASTTNSTKH